MNIITVTLSPAIDIHCRAESFSAEKENFAEITSKDAGGKGVNISRALSSCGIKSTAVVAVGAYVKTSQYTPQAPRRPV